MTHQEFISLVRQPETVNAEHLTDLKEMVEYYPFFAPARLLLTKALQKSHSIYFAGNLKLSVLYGSNRRWLYYYYHPEKRLSNEPYKRDWLGKSSGDYFDMMKMVEQEEGNSKQSLKNLADRLKSARAMVTVQLPEPIEKTTTLKIESISNHSKTDSISVGQIGQKSLFLNYMLSDDVQISESNAKKLISERKYKDAIEILKRLDLNNPKKSVYFADQIRFLEKVIANSKK